MLARPLLQFITTPGPIVRDLGAIGFWNQVSSPRAMHYNGKTYLAWTNDAGDIAVAQYVHATKTLSTPVTLSTGAPAVDGTIHVSPCILVRSSDHRIVVALVANGGSHKPGVWISTNPEDATAFGAGADIGVTAVYTYTSIVQLNGVTNDPIYLFVHEWNGGIRRLCYYKSTDGGSTWGSLTPILKPAGSDTTMFTRISSDYDTRIDIYATDSDRVTPTSSVYHYLFEADNLEQSDGTTIAGTYPLATNTGTLVQDNSLGAAGAAGATYDASGNPAVCLYIDLTTTTMIRRALWTGSAWNLHTVVADQGGLIGANPNIATAAIADHDPDVFFVPVKVGSHFEFFRYATTDGGTSWTGTAHSSSSASDFAEPEAPIDAAPGLLAVMGFGTYAGDSSFTFGVYGFGR